MAEYPEKWRYRLVEVDVPGREEVLAMVPDFHFYKLTKVLSLQVDWSSKGTVYNPTMLMVVLYRDKTANYEITLLFEGIQQLSLGGIGPHYELDEIEVEDVRDCWLEGIGYRIQSLENPSFQCSCRNLSFVSIKPLRSAP